MTFDPTASEAEKKAQADLIKEFHRLEGSLSTLKWIAGGLIATIIGGFYLFLGQVDTAKKKAIEEITSAGLGNCSILETLWEINFVGAYTPEEPTGLNLGRFGTIFFTREDAPGDWLKTRGYFHKNEVDWRYDGESIFLNGKDGEREYVRQPFSGHVFRWENQSADNGTGLELVLIHPTNCKTISAEEK